MDFLSVLVPVGSALVGTITSGFLYHYLQRKKTPQDTTTLDSTSQSWLSNYIDAITFIPLRIAEKWFAIKNKKQRDELENQKTLLTIEQQQFALQKERLDYALEALSKILQATMDAKTKGMLIKHLLVSLLQLKITESSDLKENEEEAV